MSELKGHALEMELNGTAVIVVNNKNVTALDDACTGFKGFGVGWDVAKNGRTIVMSRSEFEPDHSDQTQTLNWQKAKTGSGASTVNYDYWYTGQLDRPLDMPIEPYNAVAAGMSDRPFVTDVFAADLTYTRVKFRLGSPVNPTAFDADSPEFPMARPYIRLLVSGRKAKPPKTAVYPCIDGDTQLFNLATIAKTYITAREDGRKFAYGSNWSYRGSEAVNDEEGKALMECDTLALMALIGMDYDDSPYEADHEADATADFDTVMASWVDDPIFSATPWNQYGEELIVPDDGVWLNGLGGRIVDQGAMTWWFWDNGFVFRPEIQDDDGKTVLDLSQLRSGDLVMFRRLGSTFFDNVGHIGVIDVDEDGTVYVIHVTIAAWTEGKVVVRSRLMDEFFNLSPGRYKPEDMYFARIPYGSTGVVEGSQIVPNEEEDDNDE